MQVMITDGGPHPAEKWAQVTAQTILDDIAANAPQTGIGEAMAFRADLEALLTGHHADVQDSERAKLDGDDAHRAGDPDPAPHLGPAVEAIVALARTHNLADYFNRPETQEYLRRTIGGHFATAMDIERSWHAVRQNG